MILVLASNSPRRKQLLALGNWDFEVIVSDIDESQKPGEIPSQYVIRLAKEKVLAVSKKVDTESIIIGSDTAVIDGDEILGKPKDVEDASRILRQLRGRTHQVFTAVAFFRTSDEKLITELSITDVPMRNYSDDEINTYIKTGDPLDKAGAYAIQHAEFHPVDSLSGCYASVMGLPMCHVTRALKKLDSPAMADVPSACQTLLSYDCPVSSAILNEEII